MIHKPSVRIQKLHHAENEYSKNTNACLFAQRWVRFPIHRYQRKIENQPKNELSPIEGFGYASESFL